MKLKCLSVAVALSASGPVFAITVNISGFEFSTAAAVVVSDQTDGIFYDGQAGEFQGTLSDPAAAAAAASISRLAAAPAAAASTSFTAYCAELTQSFFFGVTYQYAVNSGSAYFGATRSADLSRLFTAAAGFVVDSTTSAALQAGIWEIIYEHGPSYDLTSGQVVVTPKAANDQAAFTTVNNYLAHLSSYDTAYAIQVLGNPDNQDFIVATTAIPEPSTWAVLAGGFGLIALAMRRRGR